MPSTKDQPRLSRLALLAIFATALAAHARGLLDGFVFDDQSAILENPVVQRGLDLARWLGSDFWGRPPGLGVGTWRPLPELGFWIDCHVGGGAAWVFHLDSLLWHAAAAVLLALAAARATARPRVAFAAGLLFAAFAVNSEAVCGLVGRADVMAAAFAFLAWWSPSALAAAAAFAAALLCKESAIVAPVWLIAADWLAAKRFETRRNVLLILTGAAVFTARAALFAGTSAVTIAAQSNPLLGESFGVRVVTALRLGVLALRLIVAPVALTADYSAPAILPDGGLNFDVVLGGAALLVAVAAVWLLRKRSPVAAMGVAIFVVGFAPISNVAALLPAIFAERLLYLPAAGVALVLAAGATSLRPRLALVVLALLVGANLARATLRAGDWRDDETLFTAATRVTPCSARSWVNVGTALLGEGRNTEAAEAFVAATRLLPAWALPWTFDGLALARVGELEEAETALRRAVQIDPDLVQATYNLAGFLAGHGRAGEAVEVLRPYVARHPEVEATRALLERIRPSGGGGR